MLELEFDGSKFLYVAWISSTRDYEERYGRREEGEIRRLLVSLISTK